MQYMLFILKPSQLMILMAQETLKATRLKLTWMLSVAAQAEAQALADEQALAEAQADAQVDAPTQQ